MMATDPTASLEHTWRKLFQALGGQTGLSHVTKWQEGRALVTVLHNRMSRK